MRSFKEDFLNRLSEYEICKELNEFIEKQERDVGNYLYYLYANAPLADVFNIDKEVLLDYAVAGDILRKGKCKDLEENMFLQNVLFHRVGAEIIKPCRRFFQDKLMSALVDDEVENVKNINYFCGDEVIYTTTDIRTLDAMTTYRSGFGRCGEESVFAVNVFRSLGIPARQVYAVYWAHCDDNHAWVEVYVDGDWKYLGACEPEEVLNKGWFNAAVARAMLICSREYVNGKILRLNQSKRYMDTVDLEIGLKFEGKPLAHTDIELQIPNFARFAVLSEVRTDGDGRFKIAIGNGHVMIKINTHDVHIPIHTERENHTTIDIEDYFMEDNVWNMMKWEAPKASDRNYIKANPPRKSRYKEKPFVNEETKNAVFAAGMENLWDILWEKDKRDIRFDILKEAFDAPKQADISNEVYLYYVQNPRVDFENLSLCREMARGLFKTKEDIESFFSKMIPIQEEMIFETDKVLKYKLGNLHSLNIAKVQCLRAIGIPAKLENGLLFVYENGEFIVDEERDGVYLEMNADIEDYMKNFSIAPKAQKYVPMTKASLQSSLFVHLGRNLIMTSKRLPNGNQAIAYEYVNFQKDKRNYLELQYMEYRLEDMLSAISLNRDFKEWIPFTDGIMIWAKENVEPVRHILGEILEERDVFKDKNIALLFSDSYTDNDALVEEMKKFNNITLIDNLGERLQEAFGRNIFINHENLPMLGLMEDEKIVYAFSGYSVGNIGIVKDIMNRG